MLATLSRGLNCDYFVTVIGRWLPLEDAGAGVAGHMPRLPGQIAPVGGGVGPVRRVTFARRFCETFWLSLKLLKLNLTLEPTTHTTE